jgi:hypothetical protein
MTNQGVSMESDGGLSEEGDTVITHLEGNKLIFMAFIYPTAF